MSAFGAEPPMGQPQQPVRNRKVTGGELLSAAWGLLSRDRELVLLPVMSSVFASIAVIPFLGTGVLVEVNRNGSTSPLWWVARVVLLFLTAWVATTIAVFFQVALVSAIFERIEGGDPTIGSAMSSAWRDRVRIVQWAFLVAVVGLIIRLVAERVGGIGEVIIKALAGVAWAIASLFVVPIIVAEGLGPIDALKRSASLISQTWGKALRAGIRFGITQFLVMLVPVGVIVLGVGVMISGSTVSLISGGAMVALGILAMIVIGVFFNALGTALNAVLYRYGAGLPTPGIDTELLANAFARKN